MRAAHTAPPSTGLAMLAGVPLRSPLIHSEPFGLGTPEAESIASYFTRLASINGFTPLQLIYGTNVAPVTRNHPGLLALQQAGATTFYRRATATSAQGARFIRLLGDLLGRPELNCLHLGRRFPGFALARFNRDEDAWCPDCLQRHKEPHSLMSWECSLVNVCPEHGCWLETACSQCGAKERCGVSRDFVRCRKCGGDRRQRARTEGVTPERVRTSRLIGDLIAFATLPMTHECCSASSCLSALEAIGTRFGHAGLHPLAKLLNVSPVTLWKWRTGACEPSLSRLVQVAIDLAIAPLALLQGDKTSAVTASAAPREQASSHPTWGCKYLTESQQEELRQRLDDLAKAFPSMGPSRAAEKLGVEPVTLTALAPERCREMVKSRRRTLERLKKARWQWFTAKIDGYVRTSLAGGLRPSWAGLQRLFRKPGLLRAPTFAAYAKAAIHQASNAT